MKLTLTRRRTILMIRAPDVVREKQLLKNIANKYNLRARAVLYVVV